MKQSNILLIIPVLLGIVVCGCQNDRFNTNDGVDLLAFYVAIDGSSGDVYETKSTGLVSTDGSISIPLSFTASEGIDIPAVTQDVFTKGRQINATGSKDTLAKYASLIGGKFEVAAFSSDSSRFIPETGGAQFDEVTYDPTTDEWDVSGATYTWKRGKDKIFYAYANMPGSADVASVSCPDITGATLTYSAVPSDPSQQKDMLLGFYMGAGKYNDEKIKGRIAEITFFHPLTAVKFEKGSFDGASEVEFKSISITNTHAGGTAKLSMASATELNAENRVVWTPGGEMQTVTLGDGSSALAVDATTNVIGGEDGVFLLVPQDLAENPVTVEVTTVVDGKEVELSAVSSSGEWKAGYTNVYKLGYDAHT